MSTDSIERRECAGSVEVVNPSAPGQHERDLVVLVADGRLPLEEEERRVLRFVLLEVPFSKHRDAPLRAESVVHARLLVLDVPDDEILGVVDDVGFDGAFDPVELLALLALSVRRAAHLEEEVSELGEILRAVRVDVGMNSLPHLPASTGSADPCLQPLSGEAVEEIEHVGYLARERLARGEDLRAPVEVLELASRGISSGEETYALLVLGVILEGEIETVAHIRSNAPRLGPGLRRRCLLALPNISSAATTRTLRAQTPGRSTSLAAAALMALSCSRVSLIDMTASWVGIFVDILQDAARQPARCQELLDTAPGGYYSLRVRGSQGRAERGMSDPIFVCKAIETTATIAAEAKS